MAYSRNNNVNLEEAPISAVLYNSLPHIDNMASAASEHSAARDILLRLIAAHGLERHFSIHLVHKHFDIPDGQIMVYETVNGPNHPDFLLCRPRKPDDCQNLRGLYFQARPDGKMAAYEFTTDPGEDLSLYTDFVSEFSTMVMVLGVQNVFALTAKQPEAKRLTEFEMPDLRSTVLVFNPTWLPSSGAISTSTDWISSEDSGNGPITLTDSTKTQSGGHYNFTCSRTRSGTHYQTTNSLVDDGNSGIEEQLYLDGMAVPKDSEPFAIISHAYQMVAL